MLHAHRSVLPVERPLVAARMEAADVILYKSVEVRRVTCRWACLVMTAYNAHGAPIFMFLVGDGM